MSLQDDHEMENMLESAAAFLKGLAIAGAVAALALGGVYLLIGG